jgi:hypothetical protein
LFHRRPASDVSAVIIIIDNLILARWRCPC